MGAEGGVHWSCLIMFGFGELGYQSARVAVVAFFFECPEPIQCLSNLRMDSE